MERMSDERLAAIGASANIGDEGWKLQLELYRALLAERTECETRGRMVEVLAEAVVYTQVAVGTASGETFGTACEDSMTKEEVIGKARTEAEKEQR